MARHKPKQTVELLDTTDIFDLYGCEYIFNLGTADEGDKAYAASRVNEIHKKYLTAARERIKSECRFLGISEKDFDSMSFSQMISKLSSMLEKELENQAENLMLGGSFNGMKAIVNAQRMAGLDLSGIDLKKFGLDETPVVEKRNSINTESLLKDPKWHVIAEAFVNLENAESTRDKILSIDYLNDLQHNSFHLLIDLQTGRMLEGESKGSGYGKHSEAVDIVKEVLDIKRNAAEPKEYAERMSRDVAKMVMSYNRINRFR